MKHLRSISRHRGIPATASNALAKLAMLVDALDTLVLLQQLANLLAKDELET